MRSALSFALAQLKSTLRERDTLFWFVLFPVFLLVILSLVFGSLGEGGTLHFDVSLLNRDVPSSEPSPSQAVEEALAGLAQPTQEGKEPLLSLHRPSPSESADAFQASEEREVRFGRRALLVVIPEGWSEDVRRAMSGSLGTTPAAVRVYHRAGSASSSIALSILEQVFAEVDRSFLSRAGRFQAGRAVAVETVFLGSATGEEVDDVDFLLPGVILMAFFTAGLFGVPGSILFAREQRILRRYWVTPFSVPQYLAGFALAHVVLCALQFTLLLLIGRLAFGATVSFSSLPAALFLVLSIVTFLSFGFFIASLTRTAGAAMAIANVINLPMTFLSGLYFQIGTLPGPLRVLFAVNPLSYLADGLRRVVGIQVEAAPLWLSVLVPILWIAFSLLVAGRRLAWDAGR